MPSRKSASAPGEAPLTRGEDAVVSFRTPVTGRLQLRESLPLAEYKFARGATRLGDRELSRRAGPAPGDPLDDIARRVAAKLALRARDFTAKFPKIVIQNT